MAHRFQWTKEGQAHRAVSADGAKVRIWKSDEFTYRARVASPKGEEIWRDVRDVEELLEDTTEPSGTELDLVERFKQQIEKYVMRYEITGIRDLERAEDAIEAMTAEEWMARKQAWQAKQRKQ